MAGRANKIMKEKRLRQVMNMIGEGKYAIEIVSTLSKEWLCNTRAVYAYITAVKQILSNEINRQDIDDLMAKFDYLYQKSMEAKDLKLAVTILNNKAKYQIGEKQRIEGDINITGIDVNIIKNRKDIDETEN